MKFFSVISIALSFPSLISCIHSVDNELEQFEESLDNISKLCETAQDNSDVRNVCAKLDRLNNKILSLEKKLQEKSPFIWPQSLEFFKSSIIAALPPSDQQCFFDWKTFSCSPICRCEWKPQFGDISPNSACRLRSINITDCSIVAIEQNLVNAVLRQSLITIKKRFDVWALTLVNSAPYSDDICHWSIKSLSCEPSRICEFSFQLGDFSLNRACRIVTDREFTSDEIQSALLGH